MSTSAASVQSLLKKAVGLHQQGNLASAERIYAEVLQVEPKTFYALHYLGLLFLQTDRTQRGIDLLRKAIEVDPAAIPSHMNLGYALERLHRVTEAIASYETVIALRPDVAEAHYARANALLDLQRYEDALASYDKAINLRPDHAEAFNNRGLVLEALGQFEKAVRSYDKAIAAKSDYARAHYNRGNLLWNLKRYDAAVASYDKAIALKPDYAEAYANRGAVLKELKRFEDAIASCDAAIALKPDHAEAYNNRGLAFDAINRFEEALASYDKSISLKPDLAEAHNNRGSTLYSVDRFDEALANYDKAIALNSNLAEAYNNRGTTLLAQQKPERAIDSYDKAVALKPEYPDAQWSRGRAFLMMGSYDRGWQEFEWRKKIAWPGALRTYPRPLWTGAQDITGKILFLYWEHGLGDTIHFCRYAKVAAAKGANVVLSVQEPLRNLLSQMDSKVRVIGPDEVPDEFDYYCALLSLPLAFGTTLQTVPNCPYIRSSQESRLFWRNRLGDKKKFRVGLVWSGGVVPDQPESLAVNNRRNVALAKFAQFNHPEIEFYSLQKGQPAESELQDLIKQNWPGPHIADFANEFSDFSATAGLIDQLDLVISVDTATGHLAGAMGKPVWLLTCFAACWRWLLDRSDSPWYPTMKLYRQKKIGEWDTVLEKVKEDLFALVGAQGDYSNDR